MLQQTFRTGAKLRDCLVTQQVQECLLYFMSHLHQFVENVDGQGVFAKNQSAYEEGPEKTSSSSVTIG